MWECLEKFRSFDKDHGGEVSLEELKEGLADKDSQGNERWTEDDIARVMSKYDGDHDADVNFDEFLMCYQELVKQCLDQMLDSLHGNERHFFLLICEHARIIRCLSSEHLNTSFFDSEVQFVFHMMSWANLLVLSLYFTGQSESTLDTLLCVFALAHWMELFLKFWRNGWREVMFCHQDPENLLCVWGTIGCLIPSLIGVVALLADDAFLSARMARFMAGLSCMCIFTKYPKFAKMIQTLFATLATSSALVSSLMAVICIYALVARDLFAEKAIDDLGEPFFSTYSRSLATFFRLFVGEG